jgi:GntR family transcriptional regulator
VRKELALSSTAKTLHLERIGYHGDVPVMMESSYWNAKLVKGLEDPELHIPDLLYALIVEKFGLPIIRAEETLTANVADQRTAKLLKIKTGDPVLTLHRKTYTSNNKIVEIRTSQGRADMFSYKTEIR